MLRTLHLVAVTRTAGHCQEIPLLPLTKQGTLTLSIRPDHVIALKMTYILITFQVIVALGILNVWIFRLGKVTPFRGSDAKNLREEFAAYGLPFWFMCVVGVLKVSLAFALLAAIWIHSMAKPAAIGLGVLMFGAFAMHFIVNDPIKKALPSLAVLAMCAVIALQ